MSSGRWLLVGSVLLGAFLGISCFVFFLWMTGEAGGSPFVVSTLPANGDMSVDPSVSMIAVTFSRRMADGGWTWGYESQSSFPVVRGRPYFTDDFMVCVLPVRLEPGKRYVLWLNTGKYRHFKDVAGIALEPLRLTFVTRQNR